FSATTPDAAPTTGTARPSAAPTPTTTSTASSSGGGLPGVTTADGTPAPLITLGALVLVAAGVLGGIALRRRQQQGSRLTPEAAWRRLRDRLRRAGVGWSDAHTPRQAAAAVRDQVVERRGRPLSPEAEQALAALATAVERERYAPEPGLPAPAELQAWLAEVLTDVSTGSRPEAPGDPLPARG
ncbi:MAG: DUF4129 domain-containing protein, partial [Micrococcales bacterium]|nr:DUF4129 domain-containing protein [Micrococcales bacterium]